MCDTAHQAMINASAVLGDLFVCMTMHVLCDDESALLTTSHRNGPYMDPSGSIVGPDAWMRASSNSISFRRSMFLHSDECDKWFHCACVGLGDAGKRLQAISGDWLCDECEAA
jgi:hypothetical protein